MSDKEVQQSVVEAKPEEDQAQSAIASQTMNDEPSTADGQASDTSAAEQAAALSRENAALVRENAALVEEKEILARMLEEKKRELARALEAFYGGGGRGGSGRA